MKKFIFLFLLTTFMCSCATSLKIEDIKLNLQRAVYVTDNDSLALEFQKSTFRIVTLTDTLVAVGHYDVKEKYFDTSKLIEPIATYVLIIDDVRTDVVYPMPPDSITINKIVFKLKGII